MMILMIILSIGFAFAYPLIVDRRLSGVNAVKLSFKAGMANFWRLFGLLMLNGLLGVCRRALLLCGTDLCPAHNFRRAGRRLPAGVWSGAISVALSTATAWLHSPDFVVERREFSFNPTQLHCVVFGN